MTTVDEPEVDPGNSEPDSWSTDLTEDEQVEVFGCVNAVAVTLAEPEGVES